MINTEFIPVRWRCASRTDVGTVRDVNEDSILVRTDAGLWAIADGMGGHRVGDIASGKIVEALESVPNANLLSDFVDAVDDALLQVNADIMHYALENFGSSSMGSTIVSMVIRGRIGVALWVGDSRIYRYRNSRLLQLSRDHSQVEEMLQMGLINEEEAVDHPQSNVITRAIGGEDELYVDVNVFSVQIGDTFLLCSDGLYNAVSSEDIEENLRFRDPDDCAEHLMSLALANQASDNVSLIVLKGESGR